MRVIAQSAAGLTGLIYAARIFGQIVAGQRVSAGTRSAADLLVFADAALAFALRGVAQGLEKVGIAVHVGQRVVEDVSAADRKEAAGEDLALCGIQRRSPCRR